MTSVNASVEASINDPTPSVITPEQLEREAQLEEELEERRIPTCYDKWIGDYKYGLFCKPRFNPWSKRKEDKVAMPFYGRDAQLPYVVAMILGFQHSLAVIGGAIVPGTVIGSFDPSGEAGNYLVSYSLIMSGICTWIQVLHTPIPRTKYFLGSGLLCVIAISFAFLGTIIQSILNQMSRGVDFDTAYGNLIGTFLIGAVCQSGIGFIPGHILQRLLPPWISGLAVFLIGVSLVGVGVEAWGGGTNCASGVDIPCNQVGDSTLPFGSPEYIGLGFLVMCTIIFLELFGSVFMRSCSFAIALLFGYMVAAFTTDSEGNGYTSREGMKEAPIVLFLWVKTFPIGFYGPAMIPVLIGYLVSSIETYGDTSATAAASGLKPHTTEMDEAIQGGLLGDAFNSFLAGLALIPPSTTLSQNIGIIAITKVAARGAGLSCGVFMLLYGIFGKLGAFFTSIPQPVLGGMTTFLFANMTISGIKVMTSEPIDRRERFILAVAASLGLGTIIRPLWFTANFLNCDAIESGGVQGLCDAAVITLTNGFAVGALAALFLNGLLPADDAEDDVVEEGQHPDGTEPETKKKLLDNEDSEEEKEKSEERPLALEISA